MGFVQVTLFLIIPTLLNAMHPFEDKVGVALLDETGTPLCRLEFRVYPMFADPISEAERFGDEKDIPGWEELPLCDGSDVFYAAEAARGVEILRAVAVSPIGPSSFSLASIFDPILTKSISAFTGATGCLLGLWMEETEFWNYYDSLFYWWTGVALGAVPSFALLTSDLPLPQVLSPMAVGAFVALGAGHGCRWVADQSSSFLRE